MFVTVISDKILQISTNCCAQLTGFDKLLCSARLIRQNSKLKKAKKNRTAIKRFYFIITNTEIGFIGWCPAMNWIFPFSTLQAKIKLYSRSF